MTSRRGEAVVDRQARIRCMVDTNTKFVARMLQKAGVPAADLDDEIQRTFLIAARRVDDVAFGAERKFLARVAFNVAAHSRRNIARRREVFDSGPPEHIEALATPEHLTGRKQMRLLLDNIASTMEDSLRVVFTLHDLEEMQQDEIAVLLNIPRGTVASRVRRARAHFRRHLSAIELAWDSGAHGTARMDQPIPLRRGRVSALERGLLRAGQSLPRSPVALAKTLAVLGLNAGGER